MKIRILPLVAVALIAASTFMSSCLDNDVEEIDLPSLSSIKSFSLGTLYQTLYQGGSKGQDTIDTVSFAKYPFVIDQLNRKIYNVDSLPKGVDISKALVDISSDTEVIYYVKDGKDTIWSPVDTIDLTNGLTLKVLTYSPTYNEFRFGEPYRVTVNVHKLNPDSLEWKHIESTSFASLTEQKAVYFGNNIYVFGKEGATAKAYKVNVNKGNVGGNWEDITALSALKDNININSALAYNNNIYYVAYGNLFKIGEPIEIGDATNLASLISVSNDSIMAYTNDGKVISLDKDGMAGTKESTSDFDFSGRFSAVSGQAAHNNDLWRTIVMSYNSGTGVADTTANVFSYISSDGVFIKNTPNNSVTCPNLENISMVKYDGKLYAFGGKKGDKIKAFDSFYYSDNNGYDWRTEPNKYMKFPAEVAGYYADKPYSCVVETDSEGKESFIWFIWHDGKISRAHLNKFAPKN